MVMSKEAYIHDLKAKAQEIRRKNLEMRTSHPGGAMSEADILAVLYYSVMNIDPKNPKDPNRDRFILSKGHACASLYSVLAMKGFYEWDEVLETYGHLHTRFQTHPDCKKTPGVEMTAGSLGQGLSVAVGMALAGQRDEKQYHVYCMVGDGECQEGQIWEAALAAAHYKLDNLICIVDNNQIQCKGTLRDLMGMEPMADKWRSFGWEVIECDGHDIEALLAAFHDAKYLRNRAKPVVILAHTIKGKGVSYMENTYRWHGNAGYTDALIEQAFSELDNAEEFVWRK